MEFVANYPLLALALVLGSALAAAMLAWLYTRGRRPEAEPLPEGAVRVYTDGTPANIRKELVGSYMLVGIGTFGANQIYRLLVLLDRAGLEKLVGIILLIENDAQQREHFRSRLPAVFRDQVVYGYSPAYAGGMINQPIEAVLRRIDAWGPPLERATRAAVDAHLRRNNTLAPSGILFFVSLGGHAPLGLPVIRQLQERFEEALTVAFTALPSYERQRSRFEQLKARYEEQGVRGWVVTDNLGRDPVTADYGMVATLVGICDAAIHADQATQPNNALAHALTEMPGAILSYQVVAREVVAYPLPQLASAPPHYFANQQAVVEEALKGLRRISEGQGIWSLDLPVGEEGTATFDIVMLGVTHDDLYEIQDAVTAGRVLREKLGGPDQAGSADLWGQANYATMFACVATDIDPSRPTCPVVVVRLAAVRDGHSLVSEMVKPPARRSLPHDASLLLPAAASASSQHTEEDQNEPATSPAVTAHE